MDVGPWPANQSLDDWSQFPVVVMATGPSLSVDQVAHIKAIRDQDRCRVIAISDAHRLAPFADMLYSCDSAWWMHYQGVIDFAGRKYSLLVPSNSTDPWKAAQQESSMKRVMGGYGITQIPYQAKPGFSLNPDHIHDGKNSGFQAINLAIHTGSKRIILVGFDMQEKDGKRHFFGPHPTTLPKTTAFSRLIDQFNLSLHSLNQAGVTIINSTPDSALTCYEHTPLVDALPLDRYASRRIRTKQSLVQRRADEHHKYQTAYTDLPNYRMGSQRQQDAQRDLTNALVPGGAYLDVGCGRGEMVDFAESIGFGKVQGTDIVPGLIDGDRVVRAEVHSLPFVSNSFDVVTMFDVIEHLIPGDDQAACLELQRVAKTTVILTANNQDSIDRGVQLHINKRSYEDWHDLFCDWFDGQVAMIDGPRAYKVSPAWRIDLA